MSQIMKIKQIIVYISTVIISFYYMACAPSGPHNEYSHPLIGTWLWISDSIIQEPSDTMQYQWRGIMIFSSIDSCQTIEQRYTRKDSTYPWILLWEGLPMRLGYSLDKDYIIFDSLNLGNLTTFRYEISNDTLVLFLAKLYTGIGTTLIGEWQYDNEVIGFDSVFAWKYDLDGGTLCDTVLYEVNEDQLVFIDSLKSDTINYEITDIGKLYLWEKDISWPYLKQN